MNVRSMSATAVLVVMVSVSAAGCGVRDDENTVVGYFKNASPLDPGSSLRAYGVPVGSVKSIQLENGDAKVAFKVDPDVLPLHADARMTIRPVNLLGEHYVELDTGTPSKPFAAQAVVPVQRTSSSVDIQDVINTFDDPASAGLATVLTVLGEGVRGGGEGINAALPKLAPTMEDLKGVAELMREQNAVLNDLIEKVAPVADAVGGDRGKNLDAVVANAESLLATLSVKQKALDATIDEMPATLRSARLTLGELSATSEAATPELRALRPVTEDLSEIAEELRTFADSADPALKSLQPVLAEADDLLRAAAPSVRRLEAAGPDLKSTSSDMVPLGDEVVDQHLEDLMLFVKKWSLSTNGRDGLSHYFRGVVHASPRALDDLLGNGSSPVPVAATRKPAEAGKSADKRDLLDGVTGEDGLVDSVVGSDGLVGGVVGGLTGRNRATPKPENATGLSADQEQNLLSQLLGRK